MMKLKKILKMFVFLTATTVLFFTTRDDGLKFIFLSPLHHNYNRASHRTATWVGDSKAPASMPARTSDPVHVSCRGLEPSCASTSPKLIRLALMDLHHCPRALGRHMSSLCLGLLRLCCISLRWPRRAPGSHVSRLMHVTLDLHLLGEPNNPKGGPPTPHC